jgi:hypothetical protein
MSSHYNDVRTPAIWTGVIKNEDLNALALNGVCTDLSLKQKKFEPEIVQTMSN